MDKIECRSLYSIILNAAGLTVSLAIFAACAPGVGAAAPGNHAKSAATNTQPAWYKDELPVLRVVDDGARNRTWILARGGVYIYDRTTLEKIEYVALPDWHWLGAPMSCSPELALGPAGEALISSDIVATLWRVDPVTFAVTRHDLALSEDLNKEVGFSGLAYSAEQKSFFAVNYVYGSLWRIDSSLTAARKIPLSEPIPQLCGIVAGPRLLVQKKNRLASLCVRAARGGATINLKTDQHYGYVSARPCMD